MEWMQLNLVNCIEKMCVATPHQWKETLVLPVGMWSGQACLRPSKWWTLKFDTPMDLRQWHLEFLNSSSSDAHLTRPCCWSSIMVRHVSTTLPPRGECIRCRSIYSSPILYRNNMYMHAWYTAYWLTVLNFPSKIWQFSLFHVMHSTPVIGLWRLILQ